MGTPTGTVYNSTSGFIVTKKGKSGASIFLFDSLDGTISGWSPGVDMTRRDSIFLFSFHASLLSPQEQVPILTVRLEPGRDRVPDRQKSEGLRVVPDG